ncbi:hypothetical protein K492DRAFT_206397 [Lichtheimia hyalospora FSU 10163]|nr:hypothetical protein K492DRAFT_206397 [Lichtheimia hyalospora FSU 10163]
MSTQDLYHISQRIAPRQKMSEQQPTNQVIVPSMFVPGPFYYYQLPPYLALPTTTAAAAPIHYPRLATPTTAYPPPIHHTLENATITYDTMVVEHSKDLVKDVFFSPAMTTTEGRDSEGSSICGQSDSDESDVASFSPSDLLQDDDPLFFIGLDLNETTTTTNKSANAAEKQSPKKKQSSLLGKRRSRNTTTIDTVKKAKTNNAVSLPGSPLMDYFEEDASTEESSDDDDTQSVADLQSISAADDNESTASWEERAELFEEAEEEKLQQQQLVEPRSTQQPTIYQKLTKANVDWCRYCGTTEGVNWRPGPWGKRTLCNKHGCDYKGYGFACKLPRLDLTGFANEAIHDRDRPVLQLFCSVCHRQESWEGNVLVRCEGCPKAVHQQCAEAHHQLSDAFVAGDEPWFCDPACQENAKRKRIVVELPRKRLPLMCAPKNNSSSNASSPSSSPMLHRRISSSSSSSS